MHIDRKYRRKYVTPKKLMGKKMTIYGFTTVLDMFRKIHFLMDDPRLTFSNV